MLLACAVRGQTNTATTAIKDVPTVATMPPTPTLSSIAASSSPAPAESQSLVQQFFNKALGTNATGGLGYIHSTKGNNQGVFADYGYNFAQSDSGSTYAGVLLGIEDLWRGGGGGNNDANYFKGGATVGGRAHPLANWGLTNFTTIGGGFALLSTTTKGPDNGKLSNINGAFFATPIKVAKKLEVAPSFLYENRSGQSKFGGNYIGGFLNVVYRPPGW